MSVKLYAEGGGDGAYLDTLFRQAWSEFLRSAGLEGRMPRIVRGKGRSQTFDLFITAVRTSRDDELPILVVDSEGPLNVAHTAWQHLKARDNWDRPVEASDNQAFLMVQVMETWFLADRDLLANYFGSKFAANRLPAWPSLEAVSKDAVYKALNDATRECSKKYSKGKVSFELLARLNPNEVETACPNARALLECLRNL